MRRSPHSDDLGSRWRGARLRWGGFVVAVLIAVATFLAWPAGDADPASGDAASSEGPPATGGDGQADESTLAPDVAFEHFDEGEVAHLADWRGKPVVVNFWASWCPPCVAEMRDALEPLHQDLGDRVVFLGINLQATEAAALDVIEETGVTYELARDQDGDLFTAFGGFGMPLTALVDEAGTVVASHTGAITRSELEALIVDQLLEQ
jgi:cytochrome c biogenesis protein CcmG, thiol:disulfide interchange protein DsbE